jgi:hypothetical protein
MSSIELQRKITKVVKQVKDEDFLLHLYELLEARVSDESEKDIVDELSPAQYKSLKKSLQKLDEGKRISHADAMKWLKSLKR